jgi:general L-amino acid transport system permease protein
MATLTDPPSEGFRLSQLIYDTRYRSMTIQVIAFILIMSGLFWLANNTVQNLSALGKDFNFAFLSNRAGYDINQRLIEYSNDSTHGRAALVGILNTLLVAFLGCIVATILGVTAGVLRLSHNWLVARLMTVYVEGFRNIPLLLWILVIFAVMTESTPQPRDFRGDDASASMILFDSVAVTNRGIFVPGPVWGQNSASSSPSSFFACRDLGFPPLRAQAAGTDRRHPPGLLGLARPLLRAVDPVLLHPRSSGVAGLPELGGFNFTGGIQLRNSLIALWFALSLYTGAFIAEIVRAGILAVSKGQTEAAYALGLRPNRTMNLVILPQALRVIIPPLISQYLNLTKNSSLAIAVGYMDVRSTLGGITINQTGRELEGMLLLGCFYLATSLIISGVMNVYNNSVKLKER